MHSFWSTLKLLRRGEVICEEPLLTIDRQMGLNVVHPDGKVRTLQSPVDHMLI